MNTKKTDSKLDTNPILQHKHSLKYKFYGLIPKQCLAVLEEAFPKQKEIDCIARFLLIVSAGSTEEYDKTKRIPTKELVKLFSNEYLEYCGELERLGIIHWIKVEHQKHGPNHPKYMHSFKIVEGIKLNKHQITSRIGRNRCRSLKEYKDGDRALKKARIHLESTRMKGAEYKDTNSLLEQGILLPKRDVFGSRIHSYISNLKKDKRQLIQYYRQKNKEIVEVDIKASHPFLSVQLTQDPEPIIMLLGEPYRNALSLFELIPQEEKEMWLNMYYGGGGFKEDFYENLALLLRGSDWINHVTDKIIAKENRRLAKAQAEGRPVEPKEDLIPDDERGFAKSAFMFAFNGADSFLLKVIEREAPFTAMILRFVSIIKLDFLAKELNEDPSYEEQYVPYKNMAAILQRTESHLIQRAYLKSNSWSHLIHDSILCLEESAGLVRSNIETVYKAVFRRFPVLKIK